MTDHLFCRMSFNVGLCDVFLLIRLELYVFGKNTTKGGVPPLSHPVGVHVIHMTYHW